MGGSRRCLLLVFYLFFYCSITALHCCVTFCCTVKYISHMHTCIPSLLDLPPTQAFHFAHPRSSQSTVLSCLCYIYSSYLAICVAHGSGHMGLSLWLGWYFLNSFHPLLPHPSCVHTSILYICISVPTLHIGSPVPFL